MKTSPSTHHHSSGRGLLAALLCAAVVSVGCGSALERSARTQLEEDGFHHISLTSLDRADNAFSFEARRDDQACQGEIEVQREMGQATATVTSRCHASETPTGE
jgi:hypothetical protein